jgi:hypothetical protein
MDTYIVINRHGAEDCPVLYRAAQAQPWDRGRGGAPGGGARARRGCAPRSR